MNRVVPIILIAAALFLHFSYCEWDFCDHEPIVSPSRMNRVIFCEPSVSYDVYLLAKSPDGCDEAQLWGLLVPVLFFGGACVVAKFEGGMSAE